MLFAGGEPIYTVLRDRGNRCRQQTVSLNFSPALGQGNAPTPVVALLVPMLEREPGRLENDTQDQQQQALPDLRRQEHQDGTQRDQDHRTRAT